jgi:hypothetical protein
MIGQQIHHYLYKLVLQALIYSLLFIFLFIPDVPNKSRIDGKCKNLIRK